MRRALVLLAAASLSGCHASAPPKKEIVLDQAIAAPAAWPQLSVGIVRTENSRASSEYLGKWLGGLGPWSSGLPADKVWRDARDAVARQFKLAVDFESLGAAHGRADLTVMLDVYATAPNSVFGEASTQLKAVLLADGRPVGELNARSDKKVTKETPFGMAFNRMRDTFVMASEEAAKSLSEQVASSPAIAELAKSAASRAVAAPAAPAAAPARLFASDVEAPGFRFPEDEKLFALVVGVEKYQSLPAAEFAERDAESVKRHLLALGVPQRNLVHLVGPAASRAALEKYVESWLPEKVEPGSRLFVYFSGHGSPDLASGDAYLVPHDGDLKYLANTGYPLKRLYERLGKLPAKRVLVAMDSCFSGAGGRSVLPKGLRPLVSKIETAESALGAKLTVLAASAADEVSGSYERAGHGLFTYHLLKSLGARKGQASPKQLYADLLPKVRDGARLENREQTPQLLGLADEEALR